MARNKRRHDQKYRMLLHTKRSLLYPNLATMTPSIRLGWMLQKGKIYKLTICECPHQLKAQDIYT